MKIDSFIRCTSVRAVVSYMFHVMCAEPRNFLPFSSSLGESPQAMTLQLTRADRLPTTQSLLMPIS